MIIIAGSACITVAMIFAKLAYYKALASFTNEKRAKLRYVRFKKRLDEALDALFLGEKG